MTALSSTKRCGPAAVRGGPSAAPICTARLGDGIMICGRRGQARLGAASTSCNSQRPRASHFQLPLLNDDDRSQKMRGGCRSFQSGSRIFRLFIGTMFRQEGSLSRKKRGNGGRFQQFGNVSSCRNPLPLASLLKGAISVPPPLRGDLSAPRHGRPTGTLCNLGGWR